MPRRFALTGGTYRLDIADIAGGELRRPDFQLLRVNSPSRRMCHSPAGQRMWILRQTRHGFATGSRNRGEGRFVPPCLCVRRENHFASHLIPRIKCFCSNPDCFLIRLTAMDRLPATLASRRCLQHLPVGAASTSWRDQTGLTAIAGNRLPANGSPANRSACAPSSPLGSNQWRLNGSRAMPESW